MAQQPINNGESGSSVRTKLNAMFAELYAYVAALISGKQDTIQFQDEGVDLGSSGAVKTVDFVGAGVDATLVGDKVTVTIPGGGGGSGSLSDITPATGANNIDNGDFLQTWLNTKLNLNHTAISSTSGRQIIFLGNSISAGQGASPITLRYSTILSSLLGATQVNNAVGGSRADQVDLSLIPTYNPATHLYLSIEYGINDLAALHSVGTFTSDIEAIINNAEGKGWPVKSIVINSVPGSYVAISSSAYNAALLSLSISHDQIYVDMTSPFSAFTGAYALYTDPDNIHPNTSGHLVLALTSWGTIKEPFELPTDSHFINDGTTVVNNLKYLNAPFVPLGYILGIDSTGAVGTINSIFSGMRYDGKQFFNGNIITHNAEIPTGFGTLDWLIKGSGKIWSSLGGGFPDIWGYLELLNASNGHTTIFNNFVNGEIHLYTNTGEGFVIRKDANVQIGNGKYLEGGYIPGGIWGRYTPFSGSGKSVFQNNYTGGAGGGFQFQGGAAGTDLWLDVTATAATFIKDFVVTDNTKGMVLKSPNGHYWRETINDSGVVAWTDIGTTPP